MKEGWLPRQRRRWFGSFSIDDPRPIAAGAPYTYFLPSDGELAALGAGDLVKLVIRSVPASPTYDAERMWLAITAADGEELIGRLENEPYDMPQLAPGKMMRFRRSQVIDLIWADGRTLAPPPRPPRRWYWERCMVDACIMRGDSPVDYLYREAPDLTEEGNEHPDSGWRIRGTPEEVEADAEADDPPQYVALGVVLNRDDSWLPLIDEPPGVAFIRNEQSGVFERHDRGSTTE